MVRFEFWLCGGHDLPAAQPHWEPDFKHALHDAKVLLAEHPELRKIDLICGQTHVGAVGQCWSSCSCGDNTCGEDCPIYRQKAPRDCDA